MQEHKLKVLAMCMVHCMVPKDLGFAGKRMVFLYNLLPIVTHFNPNILLYDECQDIKSVMTCLNSNQ